MSLLGGSRESALHRVVLAESETVTVNNERRVGLVQAVIRERNDVPQASELLVWSRGVDVHHVPGGRCPGRGVVSQVGTLLPVEPLYRACTGNALYRAL